jgi:hypothetical protein
MAEACPAEYRGIEAAAAKVRQRTLSPSASGQILVATSHHLSTVTETLGAPTGGVRLRLESHHLVAESLKRQGFPSIPRSTE